MVRRALVPAVLVVLAGCGGGSGDPPEQRPAPERRVLVRELRSPDARSPFVTAGDGAWRCRSHGRVQLAVSAAGEVSVATPVMVRCRAPGTVVVEFRGGDVTVRADSSGRLLARAAVSSDRIGVAGYWGAGCAPD
jgi:hypothetical protein